MEALLQDFGATSGSCVDLHDKSDHRQLRYVDLVRNWQSPVVDCVVEMQPKALLYVVDQTDPNKRIAGQPISELKHILGMRGEPAWLGVLESGLLKIYATSLQPDPDAEPEPITRFEKSSPDATSALPTLALECSAHPEKRHLRSILFNLVVDSVDAMRNHGELPVEEAIALTCRGVFLRYLIGRRIIKERDISKISSNANSWKDCVSSDTALAETNTWLDETFNGYFLPLRTTNYHDYFSREINDAQRKVIIKRLCAIMELESSRGPDASQMSLKWGDMRFDHIPIGLMSEIYEQLVRHYNPSGGSSTSVYYTPYNIAEYMVDRVFDGYSVGADARILDPACGAGVFLTAGFRKLVELHYSDNNKRPSRGKIRDILYDQIVGMDINPHAITLSALSLYLTALELDPRPTPLSQLKFHDLKGRGVLLDVSDPGSVNGNITPSIGSLGDTFSKYKDSFDVVIGNPPWTALTRKYDEVDKFYTKRCQEVITDLGLDEVGNEYQNPDRCPDLPFAWAAINWAKPDARIALVLAARWLFKHSSPVAINARNMLFRALSITEIVNGASVRKTDIWPSTDQPFCLVFAENKLPEKWHEFFYLSPYWEDIAKDQRLRIDSFNARPVALDLVLKNPAILKTLYKGTILDAYLINKIRRRANYSIGKYWDKEGLHCGQGYKIGNRSHKDSAYKDMPMLTSRYKEHPFYVFCDRIGKYKPNSFEVLRVNTNIYKAPLCIIRKSIGSNRSNGRALIGRSDMLYPETFFGYSTYGHSNGDFLAQYIMALANSKLYEYYILMTSAEFGVERDAQHKHDIDSFPFIPPKSLKKKQINAMTRIVKNMEENNNDLSNFDDLDKCVFDIYDLSKSDQKRVTDTLDIESPFQKQQKRGTERVNDTEMEQYICELQKELKSVFDAGPHSIQVQRLDTESMKLPWHFFSVTLDNASPPFDLPTRWVEYADNLGVSRIASISDDTPALTIGMLYHYRHWLPSRARSLAAHIILEYGPILKGNVR